MTVPAGAVGRGRQMLRTVRFPRDALPAVAVFAAVVSTAFHNGGFFPGAWTTTAVSLLWLAALALLFGGRVELGALEAAWLALLAGLVAWTSLSISWSLSHAEAIAEVRRDLVYLAAVGAVLLLAARRSAQY